MLKNFTVFFLGLLLVSSCSHDNGFSAADNYPAGWKLNDSFNVICQTHYDSSGSYYDLYYCPFGVANDADFGNTVCGFYASYETTLSSSSVAFSTVDSAFLIIPYYGYVGACNQPFDIKVYQMTQLMVSTTADSLQPYTYNPTPVGSISVVPNFVDSVYDDSTKIGPSVKIPLTETFWRSLIAPGSYSDYTAFQSVCNGLYVVPSNTSSTNGFIYFSLTSLNKIKIYGKDASGALKRSEFTTGGSNSITVNSANNARNGTAQTYANNISATGQDKMYIMGAHGYYGSVKLPSLKNFASTKSIFKAELVLSVADTNFAKINNLGLLRRDTANVEYAVEDQSLNATYFAPTVYFENGVWKYKFNITTLLNYNSRLVNNTPIALDIYAAPIYIYSGYTKLSKYQPNRILLYGNGGQYAPKLNLYYLPNK